MNLTEKLASASLVIDMVLYILIFMSVVSVAIIIERLIAFNDIKQPKYRFKQRKTGNWKKGWDTPLLETMPRSSVYSGLFLEL